MTDEQVTTQGASPRIGALLAEMTLAEKVGQMTQASNDSISPAEIAKHSIGSVLSGGNGNPSPNTPSVWREMVGSFLTAAAKSRLGVPLLYGVDAVHGHSNVGGSTVFPHNIGLGAIDDPELVRRIGRITATEMLATGVHWTFAPTIAVPQDLRWGRTYEGYGRHTELVGRLGSALIEGLQDGASSGEGVLACAKHFVGDGGAEWATVVRSETPDWWEGWGDNWRIDQGDMRVPEDVVRAVHLPPYAAAIDAGVMTVMASYNSWNGDKLHGHRMLLTDVLKGELGFRGFVISDWMGIDQLDDDYDECVVRAVNAGVDMVMVPLDWERFIDSALGAVAGGRISIERIDDAVRRILLAKHAAGLFDRDAAMPPLDVVGADDHRAVASEAVRRSATLLKNDGGLPLTGRVAIAGSGADDIGLQCGGWTVGWQGGVGGITSGSTLLDGLRAHVDVAHDPAGRFAKRYDVGVVCVAEQPYAEGPGDCAEPTVSAEDRAVFERMRAACEFVVLVVFSGRPLVIPDLVARADSVVAAWLPGTEGAALADVLTGRHPFTAGTPQPWPASMRGLDPATPDVLFPVGHGIHTN